MKSQQKFTAFHRLLHWIMAIAMPILFITGFLRMYWWFKVCSSCFMSVCCGTVVCRVAPNFANFTKNWLSLGNKNNEEKITQSKYSFYFCEWIPTNIQCCSMAV